MLGVSAWSVLSLGVQVAFADTASWTVHPGETFWSISKATHSSVSALEQANPHVNPSNVLVGTVLNLPQAIASPLSTQLSSGLSLTQYTVLPGDTFWTISRHFNITLSSIVNANPGRDAMDLIPGSVVNVPTSQKFQPLTAAVTSTPATSVSSPTSNDSIAPTKPSASTVTASSSNVSAQDLYWMAHVIHAEAGGLGLQTEIAIGDVVMHRLEAPGYPKTVQGVVFQQIAGHYQFTCVPNHYVYTQPGATSIQAAQEVLQHHVEEVPGAMVFFDGAHTPASSWVWQQPKLTTVGPFIFAK